MNGRTIILGLLFLVALQAQRTTLSGSRSPQVQPENDQGPVEATFRLPEMMLMLRQTEAQKSALAKLLEDQQNPNSPDYRKWLTPDQYADRFGATQSDIDRITAWLRSMGFTSINPARGKNRIAFSGTAAQVQTAFGTRIHRYVVKGETHFAPATEPSIPTALAPLVSGITGLDDFHPHPLAKLAPHFTSGATHYLAP